MSVLVNHTIPQQVLSKVECISFAFALPSALLCLGVALMLPCLAFVPLCLARSSPCFALLLPEQKSGTKSPVVSPYTRDTTNV